MFGLGAWELIVILVIILVLFGGKKLPQLARSLGQGAKEIRKGFDDGDENEASQSKSTATPDENKSDDTTKTT